jgi:hypothetical protein
LAKTLTDGSSGMEGRRQEISMDDLTFTLRTLCLRNRDGSHATQADRLRALVLMSRQLREHGFRADARVVAQG